MRKFGLTCISVLTLWLLGVWAYGPTHSPSWNYAAPAAAALNPPPPQENLEYNTNRPGSDYKDYELSEANPAICRDDCARDPSCKAFTYVRPGLQGARAHCWLKSDAPNAEANDCCVSGVKRGGSAEGALEVNWNRQGGDYRDYDLANPDPYQCRKDCENDPRCQAFTYLRPSYWGPNAHCFLKDRVPEKSQNGCCISGVVRGGGGGGAGCDFSITSPGTVPARQQITVGFTAPKNRNDKAWIGIYPPGADPKQVIYLAWSYVGAVGQCSGTVQLSGQAPGRYDLIFFGDNNSDKIVARASFTVQ